MIPIEAPCKTDGASGPGRTSSPKTSASGPPEIPHSKSVPISLCPQSRRCGISPLVAPQAPAANWVSSLDAVVEPKLFLRAAGEDDREIIPPQLLRGLTLDRVDWERSTLIDDDTSAVFLRPVFEPVDERV